MLDHTHGRGHRYHVLPHIRAAAVPPGTVRVVLNVDIPDRALTATALYFASPGPSDGPELWAADGLREAAGFAVKGFLIAAGRTSDLYHCQAIR